MLAVAEEALRRQVGELAAAAIAPQILRDHRFDRGRGQTEGLQPVRPGAYDGLPETNAAIEAWIEANGYAVAGPMWEWYVTDPGETPEPADWRTEVYWPLQA